jgi:hypothetical protein
MKDYMFKKNTIILFLITGGISFCLLIGYALYSLKYGKDVDLLSPPMIQKQKAIDISEDFIKSLGFDVKNYPSKIIEYKSRNQEMFYLLNKYSNKEIKNLIDRIKFPYTYWLVTYSVIGERLGVGVNDRNGKIISYELFRLPLREEKITNLNQRQIMDLVENFLVSQGEFMSHLELLSQGKRHDYLAKEYYFRWKKQNKELGDVNYLINLDLKGDKITAYSHNLELPDSFIYSYRKGIFISLIWANLSLLLYLIVVVILICFTIIKRKNINWQGAKLGGIICGFLYLVSSLNTQINYVSFADIIFKLIWAIVCTFATFILIASSELSFRESFGRTIFMEKNKKNIISAIIVSYSLTVIFMLLNIVSLELLKHFKIVWEVGVGDVESSILTSNVIYLAPFLIGIIPALIEEFLRGFTIAFSRKILKSTFISILLSAFIWGFAHTAADGSIIPGYAHSIQFFVYGIIIAYLLLHFGIEVTIIWHFLNNFVVTNLFLLFIKKSLTIYGVFSLIFILSTFFVATILYFKESTKIAPVST